MNTRIVKATVKQRQCQRERQKSIRFNKRNNNFAFVSHFWYISLPASFPDVSFPMLSCAQRKVRRRKRASLLFPFRGPLRFVTRHLRSPSSIVGEQSAKTMRLRPGRRQFIGSKLCVLDTDDLKIKTSLFSVQGKIYLVLFHDSCSIVLRHLCPVHEVNDVY